MKKFIRFPVGMMSIAFSQSEQKRESKAIESALDNAESNTDARPALPFLYQGYRSRILSGDIENPGVLVKILEWLYKRWLPVTLLVIGLYIAARFLLSRKMSRRLMFASFENGLYAMGAELLILFAYQTCCGTLYQDLAAAVGIFIGGAAIGAWSSGKNTKLRHFFMFSALVIPLLVLPTMNLPYYYARFLMLSMLALSGASVGAAYSEFNRRSSTKKGAGLWSAEMFGGAIGIIFIILFLLPAGGCLYAALILALLRAPLLLRFKK
jgi:hypothetical protein